MRSLPDKAPVYQKICFLSRLLTGAGLAAQNIELMAVSLGLGCLYNGYLSRITDVNAEAKEWLGIKDKSIKACMLLGYPNVSYKRTAPRRRANVIWK